jgi:signal transduction histidine kinase
MGIDLLGMRKNITSVEQEPLIMMKAALELISDTIDNVLDLQKMEEGKFELDMGPFSFEDCINKLFLIFSGSALKKNISLLLRIFPNMPSQVIGDSHRIQHVIGNLLSNALKFSPKDTSIYVEIKHTHTTRNPDGGELANVLFTIEDFGPGISKENQNLLFHMFSQIPGTSPTGKGSGLGLMFCKEIVNLHGIYIYIHMHICIHISIYIFTYM